MNHDKRYIEKFILLDLPDPEIEEFRIMIESNPTLRDEVEIIESEMIERYLDNTLEEEFIKKFEERIRSDSKFLEKVKFTKSLDLASKKIRRNEIKDQLHKVKQRLDLEKLTGHYQPVTDEKRNLLTTANRMELSTEEERRYEPVYEDSKEDTLYSMNPFWAIFEIFFRLLKFPLGKLIIGLSILAIVTALLLHHFRIRNFYLQAEEIQCIEIMKLPGMDMENLPYDSIVQPVTVGIQKISLIMDERLKEKYFVRDSVLYTYGVIGEEFHIFQNTKYREGAFKQSRRFQYYLCKEGCLNGYSMLKKNKIYHFEKVEDPDLLDYCNN